MSRGAIRACRAGGRMPRSPPRAAAGIRPGSSGPHALNTTTNSRNILLVSYCRRALTNRHHRESAADVGQLSETVTAAVGFICIRTGPRGLGADRTASGYCWLQTRGGDGTRLGLVPSVGPGLGRITCPGCCRHACSDRRRSRRCQPTSGCASARPCRGVS